MSWMYRVYTYSKQVVCDRIVQYVKQLTIAMQTYSNVLVVFKGIVWIRTD